MSSFELTAVSFEELAKAVRRSLLGGLALSAAACANDEIITDTSPYLALGCHRTDWARLSERSADFAHRSNLHFMKADYAFTLTNERLNFIVTVWPGDHSIRALAISRTKPTLAEQDLFSRYVSEVGLQCTPEQP